MKKIILNIKLIVLFAGFYATAISAQPAALWTKYYNNFLSNKDDNIVKSITDNNGNIYVLGSTLNSQNNWDIITIKYDGSGNLKWVRVYNGETNDTDIPQDICLDPQGNVYIAGETVGLNSVIDGMVLKYDTTGTLKFTRLYNRTNIAGRQAYSQNIMYKNALYVTCRFLYNDQKECGIMKLTTLGDSLTYRVLGSGSDHFFSYAMTYDDVGNIYVSTYGKYNPGEENDIGVYKMNHNTMNIEWTKKYSGPSHKDDYPYDIKIGPDGNIFLCGSSFQNNQGSDFMVFKMGRDDGAIIWQNRLNNPEANQNDYGRKIAFDNNANIIVGGISEGLNTSADIFTVKFSPTGAILWQKRYNYNTTREDRFSDLLCDEAGNVYVGGYSYRDGSNIMDMVILKYGSNGAFDWSKIQPGYTAFDKLASIHLDQAGNLVASGQLTPSNTESDILIVKYGSTIGIQQISGEVPSHYELQQNYPNPFNPVTNIKFSIPKAGIVKLAVFDAAGRQVAELVNKDLGAGIYNFDFNASHLSSGIYFYRIDAEGFTQVKKMILVK